MGEKVYGLLGRKLGHSWSVPIHEAFGCQGYRLIELEPEALAGFLRREDIGGLNVTIPYKREVMKYCDEIDPAAEAIGSVNTLVRREGKLIGYNTDIDGFQYMLQRAEITLTGKKVVILGSGGASLTARAAARQAREVVIVSRTGPDNYETLPERHADAEVLINTTPVGMWPKLEGQPLDLTLLPKLEAVVDVIYNPGRTNLLLQAQALGLRHAGGLPMLVSQAKRAEERFFSKLIPDREVEAVTARLWRHETNLVLIGMPGSGKTTVGKALAHLSGKTFADLDQEIVQRSGRTIPEIFAKEGEGAFRELEQKVLEEVCAKSGQVIATGGGAILRSENREALRRTGWVIQLKRPLEDLPTEGRPLSKAKNLAEMARVRAPLYKAAADVSIINEISPEKTAEAIWRDFSER